MSSSPLPLDPNKHQLSPCPTVDGVPLTRLLPLVLDPKDRRIDCVGDWNETICTPNPEESRGSISSNSAVAANGKARNWNAIVKATIVRYCMLYDADSVAIILICNRYMYVYNYISNTTDS